MNGRSNFCDCIASAAFPAVAEFLESKELLSLVVTEEMENMEANSNLQKLKNRLDSLGIEYQIIEHRPITTVEEGLRELGIEAADGVSTLIMRADDKFISIIRRDDRKLSFKKIKKRISAKVTWAHHPRGVISSAARYL
ncbi:MAG: hypothetical protein HZB51_22150 [Chloroflexi bacterium]|nr:hypothetical protein [Chloroflexota bacterium]